MKGAFDHQDYEDWRAKKTAKEFERKLQDQELFYLDLIQVEEIYVFYFQSCQYDRARNLLHFALQTHPASADLYFKLAQLDHEQNQYAQGLRQIEEALLLSPMVVDYALFKAELLARLDRFSEAEELLLEWQVLVDEPAAILLQLGNLAQICGLHEISEQYYRKSVAAAPDEQDALFELAFLLESMDRVKEGVQLYVDFLEEYPYAEMVWYNLGILYRKIGNYEKALEAFDYALIIQDDLTQAYLNKGLLLVEMNRTKEALQAFLEASSALPNDAYILYYVGECFENLELFQEAIRYYGKASRLDPDFFDAWVGLGYCLEKKEKFLEAIHYYEKAQQLDDEQTDLCLSLAICEYKLGNRMAAFRQLEKAISLNPHDMAIWQDWSQMLFESGNQSGAITYLEEAIKVNPSQVDLYYQCAAYCLNQQEREKGLLYLENALILDAGKHYMLYHIQPTLQRDPQINSLVNAYSVIN
ncbi:MAG: tetratricopeptide repeat protein [Bacteroidota bacterium]